MTVPKEVTVTTVEEELTGVKNYAARHEWQVHWDAEALRLTFEGLHPNDNTKIQIIADLDGYRALPPAWFFQNPLECTQQNIFFPKPGVIQGVGGSIFHGSNVICAPFNRLAYQVHKGPHNDWGGPECWLNVRGHIRETTLAGMFASIIGHLNASPGMNK